MNLLHGSRFSIKTNGVTMTPGAYNEIVDKFPTEWQFQAYMQGILTRHVSGDWGDVCKQDAKANDDAVKSGARILSAYKVEGVKLWVISDAAWTDDPKLREVTTILRPSDY